MDINGNMVCVIPARGKSKGIVNKNIREVNKKPLIYYSIREALKSNIFERIIVSTDSEKIAKIARDCGAEVPFIRPSSLATDESLVQDTLCHTLKYLEKNDKKYNYVCLVQATSPLILHSDIIEAWNLLHKKNGDMVISVSPIQYNSYLIGTLEEDLSMKNFITAYGTRRQDFEEKYILNGSIYMGKGDIFYYKKDYYKCCTYAYIMPYGRHIDIDSFIDLEIASFLLEKRECGK